MLLMTLVVLTILATLAYTLTSQVSAYRHRQHYMMNYQLARYGCDSGIKYAIALIEDLDLEYASRAEKPDFSDVFAMDQQQYEQLIQNWIARDPNVLARAGGFGFEDDLSQAGLSEMVGGLPGSAEPNESRQVDLNDIDVPGPYGPAWPRVMEDIELKIGDVEVVISIEDENARYPLGWVILDDEDFEREAQASFQVFCEWMDMPRQDIESIRAEMSRAGELKVFPKNFSQMQRTVTTYQRQRTAQLRGREQVVRRESTRRQTVPATVHMADFSRIFHSALLDNEVLARPLSKSQSRNDSALTYISRWGSNQVNVNTAPRHVLEAVFTFGGNASGLAEAVIEHRRVEPFEDFEHLRTTLLHFSNSLDRCEELLVFESDFFSIKVEAFSGGARASARLAVKRDEDGTHRVAVLYD